jgi:hypothetical protein
VRKYPKFYSILRKQGTTMGRKEERKDEGRGRVKEVREKRVKSNIRLAAGWRKGRKNCL